MPAASREVAASLFHVHALSRVREDVHVQHVVIDEVGGSP